jgi:hypothetical protein
LYANHFHGTDEISELTVLVPLSERIAEGSGGDLKGTDDAREATVLRKTMDEIAAALAARFPLVYQRDISDPRGLTRARFAEDGDRAAGSTPNASGMLDRITNLATAAIGESAANSFYLGGSGRVVRFDVGLSADSRSNETMDLLPEIRRIVSDVFSRNHLQTAGNRDGDIALIGDTPLYADLRALRERDFLVIGMASAAAIALILIALVRSILQTVILIAATFLTYLSAYGLTWLIFRQWFDVSSLNWQVNFFLFIIILSLGQDYNIFVVTRIREELIRAATVRERSRASRRHLKPETTPDVFPPQLSDSIVPRIGTNVTPTRLTPLRTRLAVARAIRQTGGVVSSCGLIMAATFASMFSGSLLLMKEMAVAITIGILIDTFVVRPLLVPAMILLTLRRAAMPTRSNMSVVREASSPQSALAELLQGKPVQGEMKEPAATTASPLKDRVET